MMSRHHISIRRYEFFASRTPPEPSLLNSFYLEDLAKARDLASSQSLPRALQFYLGMHSPGQRTDLLEDQAGLRTLLQPALTPLGRWPGPGRFSLALLQQAAVNGTSGGLRETGILSVNGPPEQARPPCSETSSLHEWLSVRQSWQSTTIRRAHFTRPGKPYKEAVQG